MAKNCGSCIYYFDEDGDSFCRWSEPKLPFWAHISNGDHGEYVQATDGRNCPAWEPKK